MLCGIFGKPKDNNSLYCTHCNFKHEPQAASGVYSCRQRYKGRDGHARHCGGTYQVLRGQAEKVMQDFRRRQLEERNAAVKATEKARKAARKNRQQDTIGPHSRRSKPLPAVPLQVFPHSGPNGSNTQRPRRKPVAEPERSAVRRREATHSAGVPIQALGKEWNHGRGGGQGGKHSRPKQANVATAVNGSWYQPAPATRTRTPRTGEAWYHPL